MKWQEILKKLESSKEWDMAIIHMQEVIEQNPDNVDVYLSFLYLLMSILMYEDYTQAQHDYYAALCKKYFDESYEKFSKNPEYLYYAGRIAVMSEWYFGIEAEERNTMIDKAPELDPENLVYQWNYYCDLADQNPKDKNLNKYLDVILDPHSSIQKELSEKGSLGEYILGMMKNWAKEIKGQIRDSKMNNLLPSTKES